MLQSSYEPEDTHRRDVISMQLVGIPCNNKMTKLHSGSKAVRNVSSFEEL